MLDISKAQSQITSDLQSLYGDSTPISNTKSYIKKSKTEEKSHSVERHMMAKSSKATLSILPKNRNSGLRGAYHKCTFLLIEDSHNLEDDNGTNPLFIIRSNQKALFPYNVLESELLSNGHLINKNYFQPHNDDESNRYIQTPQINLEGQFQFPFNIKSLGQKELQDESDIRYNRY